MTKDELRRMIQEGIDHLNSRLDDEHADRQNIAEDAVEMLWKINKWVKEL